MREILAIGVISGTSADGIDAAALLTDGDQVTRTLGGVTVPYAEDLRAEVLSLMAAPERVRNADLTKVESAITAAHVAAVEHLIAVLELSFADIGVVGFHGQTVLHRPADGFSRQLFDGAAAARRLGLPVVADFRTADMAAGGEGAPLAPIDHAARVAGGVRPMAVLNLGGIGNLTWLGADERLVAFDTGPANALLDDW
ncbi:MAG: anhydro-N-acetylmuramic acid kinase, partial [Pseudomonadota bacterium]|nr:anhydro-N-acetylmuramic acid kinase [Pseudomonadota bacterium]